MSCDPEGVLNFGVLILGRRNWPVAFFFQEEKLESPLDLISEGRQT